MEKFILSDFLLIRNPAYPIRLLFNFYNSGSEYRKELEKIYADKSIQIALHASTSKEFYNEFNKWMQGLKTAKEKEKIEETLIKYLVRFTTRCVPFGLFSGFSVCEFGTATTFKLNKVSQNVAHLRLDMEYLQDIFKKLMEDVRVRESVKFYSNTSLYQINNKFKYVEYTTDTYIRKYNNAVVDVEEYLNLVLEKGNDGGTINDFVDLLIAYDEEITTEDARNYIDQLITSQLLVSDLEPNITGKDNLLKLIDILSGLDIENDYLSVLKEIQRYLSKKKYSIQNATHIKSLVEKIVGTKDYWSVLQCDLELSKKGSAFNIDVISNIKKQVENLSPFALGVDRTDLLEFKEKFLSCYDTQEVPLMEALDPELGVGYGNLGVNSTNSLLKDIHFNYPPANLDPISQNQNHLSEFVKEKYIDFLKDNSNKITLSDTDLDKIKSKNGLKSLPDSFFIHGSMLANSVEALDNGKFMFQLKNVSGPPSCLTIGRFCYTSDSLTEKVKSCLKQEEELNPEAIYAEIVHLTDARIGNVTIRPHLRDYEIQYLGKSDMPTEKLIPVSDLIMSIRDNEIVLRSKTWDKVVIPRLTNAHVFAESKLPVYKFLGELQRSKGGDWLSWHWHDLINQKFLPRVEYKNIILKTARWLLTIDDLQLTDNDASTDNIIARFKELAIKLNIPRFASFYEESDKEFVLDLYNENSCLLVAKKIVKEKQILIEEYLQFEDHCYTENVLNEKFANEIVIPVNKVIDDKKKQETKIVIAQLPVERKFFIGSDWIYIKIYTGKQTVENIVRNQIDSIIKKLIKEKIISSWHYLRYADPEYHLRIRFKGNNLKVLSALNELFVALKSERLTRKLQIDTYDREIERYGSYTMEDSEQVFSIDSSACLSFIKLTENYDDLNDRWLWCIRAIDKFLDCFNYACEHKQRLMANLESYFIKSNNCSITTLKQINARYRVFGDDIKYMLVDDLSKDMTSPLLFKAESILNRRDRTLKMTAAKILKKIDQFHEVPIDELVGSYIHLFVNRLFISNPNRTELMIYIFLNKSYLTQLKKSKL